MFRLFAQPPKKISHHTYPIVFVLLSAALSIVRFNDIPVGSFFDDAHYLVLAESLVEGQGYHLINYPHAPAEMAFPPGWPLLLMPVTAVFGNTLFWPRVLSLLFWLAAIPLANKLFSHRLPAPLAAPFLALVALNPHLIGMAGTAMSEAAFLFFTLLTLVLLQRWLEQPDKRSLWQLLALGLAAFVAMLVRSIGIALLAAVVITLLRTLRRNQLRWLLLFGGSGLIGLILLAWFSQQTGGALIFSPRYSEHLAYLLPRWTEFLRFWEVGTAVSPETLANAVLPIFELQAITALLTPGMMRLLAITTLLLIFAGLVIHAKEMAAAELYVLGYAAIFYVWIIYIDTVQPRIALPLIPFATFYLVTAVDRLTRWLAPAISIKQPQRLAQITLALLLILHLGRNVYATLNPIRSDIVDLAAGTTWIAANLPSDAVVMTPNPVPDYLYMRRLTVDYPADTAQIAATLHSVDYILIRPSLTFGRQVSLDAKGRQLLNYIQSNSSQFELIYQDPSRQVWVYQTGEKS